MRLHLSCTYLPAHLMAAAMKRLHSSRSVVSSDDGSGKAAMMSRSVCSLSGVAWMLSVAYACGSRAIHGTLQCTAHAAPVMSWCEMSTHLHEQQAQLHSTGDLIAVKLLYGSTLHACHWTW